jgi:TatD DNase family protein
VIDFHCHLDLYRDPHAVTRECVDRNLYILSVTTTPSAWAGTSALAKGATRIRTALGLHPQLAHERKSELPLFEKLLPETRYVGEVGLDGAPECRPHWADQQTVFAQILSACADAGGRVLSIHSRRAATAVLDAFEASPGAGIPVLHWFSGTSGELARAVELGCWFSIGPAMLRSDKGRKLASEMPRTRILTETDGPFAQVDDRAAMPWDVDKAVQALAEAWGEPADAVQATLDENLRRLATIPPIATAP